MAVRGANGLLMKYGHTSSRHRAAVSSPSRRRRVPALTGEALRQAWREMSGRDALDWGALVARSVHPTRLWIIEAMLWLERPLSATELEGIFDKKKMNLSSLSYHVNVLVKFGIVREVSERPVRGATEHFYYFTKAVLK